ncbi:MAG: lipopolysaccharide biosynthesis protein [Promethearchaeota archaeon]
MKESIISANKDTSKSIASKAFKEGSWLGILRFISQIFSWIITLFVARILSPQDYGLMSMATILTGYAMIFNELGMGDALIQKKNLSSEELSSAFWFTLIMGILFGLIAILLAYPTSEIFNDRRLIPITQLTSILFIISGFSIVPLKILDRKLLFKKIGVINLSGVFVSGISMLLMAINGFGVWTLILGHIIRNVTKLFVTFRLSHFKPKFYFKFSLVRPFLKFGINVAGARSLFYIYTKSDRFVAGKLFNANLVGFYQLALELASIPTDKIISVIQQVSYPVLSKFQDQTVDFNKIFLRLTRFISIIVFPIFIGAAFIADNLIPVILGEKWIPIIHPFKLLCFAQLVVSMTVVQTLANNAQGRPRWGLYFTLLNTIFMPVAFYLFANKGFDYLPLAWLTVYPTISIGYTLRTLRKIGVSKFDYFRNLISPIFATIIMVINIYLISIVLENTIPWRSPIVFLIIKILTGALSYIFYFIILDKKDLRLFKELLKK